MNYPHDNWAEVYDLAYEEEFGPLYADLTTTTIETICELMLEGSCVIDFGAGTGRLSIPLADLGYSVTAVEPSGPMLDCLKAKDAQIRVTCVQSSIGDYRGTVQFDFGLCVFTVVIYLLDDTALQTAFQSVWTALKPGGQLLIDIPSPMVFRGRKTVTNMLTREVTLHPVQNAVYLYRERITVREVSGERLFEDQFQIRCWTKDEVLECACACGFEVLRDLSDRFVGTGSHYYVLQKVG